VIHFKALAGGIRPEGRQFRRARSPGKANFDVQHEEGDSFYHATGRWHRVTRIIDRVRNWYFEHIVDAESGELMQYKDEPLSKHRSGKTDDTRHGPDAS
jgi:hypothetical protein